MGRARAGVRTGLSLPIWAYRGNILSVSFARAIILSSSLWRSWAVSVWYFRPFSKVFRSFSDTIFRASENLYDVTFLHKGQAKSAQHSVSWLVRGTIRLGQGTCCHSLYFCNHTSAAGFVHIPCIPFLLEEYWCLSFIWNFTGLMLRPSWYDKGAWPNPLWNGLAWWFGQEGAAQGMSTPLSKSSPLANYIVP